MKQTDSNSRPFDIRKKEVKIYRMIFLAMGFLFFGLTFLLFQQSPIVMYQQMFPTIGITKWVVTFIALLFCLSSFAIFATMKAEFEVLRQILRAGRAKLHRIYLKKHAKYGPFTSFSTDVEEREKSFSLKHHYHNLIEEMEMERDRTYLALQKVNDDLDLEQGEREGRYNEILSAFKVRLDVLNDSFDEVS